MKEYLDNTIKRLENNIEIQSKRTIEYIKTGYYPLAKQEIEGVISCQGLLKVYKEIKMKLEETK